MAFPNTSILDNFTGTGALSASWSPNITTSYALWERDTDVAKATGFRSAYWNTRFLADQEVFATIAVMPSTQGARLYTRISNPGGSYNAYGLAFSSTGTFLNRYVGAATTTIQNLSVVLNVGDEVGLSVVGNQISVWQNGALMAGWPAFTDNTITGNGFIGMWSQNDVTVRLDDFGGGNVPIPIAWTVA